MAFKAMNQDLVRALISNETDIITPHAEMEAEIFKQAKCPVCGHVGARKIMEEVKVVPTKTGVSIIKAPFNQHSPLIQGHALCVSCQTEYSPRTGVIIKQADPVITHPGIIDE